MKKIILIFFFLFSATYLYPQLRERIDSVLQLLRLEKRQDTTQVRRYIRLCTNYVSIKPDSTLYYCDLALVLSEKLNYKWGEANAYRNYSSGFKVMGDYPRAWEYLQRAKKIYSEQKDEPNLLFTEYSGGTLNWAQGNYQEALKIFLSIKPVLEEKKLTDIIVLYPFLSSTYTNLQKPDSGLFYIRKVITSFTNLNSRQSFPLKIMGDAYFKLKKPDSAMFCYRNSYLLPGNSISDLINAATGMAVVFKELGNTDSCIFYASTALNEAQNGKFQELAVKAAGILADAFQKINPSESIRYYKLASALNDSINNQQKIIQVQNLKYTEELRKRDADEMDRESKAKVRLYLLIGGLTAMLLITFLLVRNNLHKQKAKEKIEKAYDELKSTQSQLIQSEKMASLGELTAGIAHEIQNPLNFVNNFSEVSTELVNEMNEEIKKGNLEDATAIANDLKQNLEKINHHGKRAADIVKGMLQHSRSSSGHKEPTDINALADEYLRLAYHGLRAKDKTFNATMKTDYDATIGNINIIPQDIGRVILNLITNAFYVVNEKALSAVATPTAVKYEPTVSVSTKKSNGKVEIKVADNGNGISQKVMDKIFQPFFTTKPTGQGTGLGLSLSYDIVKAHGGEIKVETKENEGTAFTVILPV